MTAISDFIAFYMTAKPLPAGTVASLARYDIADPHRLSRRRAAWYALAYYGSDVDSETKNLARRALLQACRYNGRNVADYKGFPVINRLGKASTLRLAFWAQDKGTEI